MEREHGDVGVAVVDQADDLDCCFAWSVGERASQRGLGWEGLGWNGRVGLLLVDEVCDLEIQRHVGFVQGRIACSFCAWEAR